MGPLKIHLPSDVQNPQEAPVSTTGTTGTSSSSPRNTAVGGIVKNTLGQSSSASSAGSLTSAPSSALQASTLQAAPVQPLAQAQGEEETLKLLQGMSENYPDLLDIIRAHDQTTVKSTIKSIESAKGDTDQVTRSAKHIARILLQDKDEKRIIINDMIRILDLQINTTEQRKEKILNNAKNNPQLLAVSYAEMSLLIDVKVKLECKKSVLTDELLELDKIEKFMENKKTT